MLDIWEEFAMKEITYMQEMIEQRRDALRKAITVETQPEELQSVLAAIWVNGQLDAATWRLGQRMTKGVMAG